MSQVHSGSWTPPRLDAAAVLHPHPPDGDGDSGSAARSQGGQTSVFKCCNCSSWRKPQTETHFIKLTGAKFRRGRQITAGFKNCPQSDSQFSLLGLGHSDVISGLIHSVVAAILYIVVDVLVGELKPVIQVVLNNVFRNHLYLFIILL